METPELSISIGELLGVPRISIRGCMAGWHDQAVMGVLMGLRNNGVASVVFDMAGLVFEGTEGASSMVSALRSLGTGMCVHIIASGPVANILQHAGFGPAVRLYSSTDEIAEYLCPNDIFLSSRWMAGGSDDIELPIAA